MTVAEGLGLGDSAGWATDVSAGPANESGQTLSFFNVGNDNPASLFSSQPAIAANGTLSFHPGRERLLFGSAVVTVSLSDNGGTANGGDDPSDALTFPITVNAVNDAPSFTAGADVTVAEDAGGYSAAWASDSRRGRRTSPVRR